MNCFKLISEVVNCKYVKNQGRAEEKGLTADEVDPKELAMGIEVEKEHTDTVELAEEIALDHLAEIPDYYTRLKKMEKEAGVKEHE